MLARWSRVSRVTIHEKIIKVFSFLLLCNCLTITVCKSAERIITDPLKNGLEPGVPVAKWVVDINGDGVDDVLLSQNVTPKEILQDGPALDVYGFDAYIGLKNGGFINSEYVMNPYGKLSGGIVVVDITQCYVGYIDEVKSHGIVTVQSKYSKKDDITKYQVVCYTINGDHMDESFLGKEMDPEKPNRFYQKYLSPAKLTKVELQTITP